MIGLTFRHADVGTPTPPIQNTQNDMADNENATRAPESDAQEKPAAPAEESVFPGDTIAQEGPSMGVSQIE